MLTKSQIEKIQRIIRSRTLAFTHEAIGPRALTAAELSDLKKMGLIRESVKDLIADPYLLGKLSALVDREKIAELDYRGVMQAVKQASPALSGVEQQAINWAKEHAGQYIRGLGEDLAKEAGAIVARRATEALRAVRDEVADAIKNRKTTSELKTALYDAVDDKYRDWQRVAFTETNNALQNGIYNEIRDNSDDGADQLVYKRPQHDACKYCKALYLRPDGVTPRIFRLKDLKQSNIGKKARDWEATVDAVHPWCSCALHSVIDGFNFVKKRVVKEPFTVRGREYKAGQVVEERIAESLSPSQKAKLRMDAVLQYTGETAKLTEKSLIKSIISETDNCICIY